jgi:hypothetical protein
LPRGLAQKSGVEVVVLCLSFSRIGIFCRS